MTWDLTTPSVDTRCGLSHLCKKQTVWRETNKPKPAEIMEDVSILFIIFLLEKKMALRKQKLTYIRRAKSNVH